MLASLTDQEAEALLYEWRFWARPNQLPPGGDWRVWLVLAGRGFGKTRTGAEWVREQVESGASGRIALVAPTAGDARDVIVEGESGILAISPPGNRPLYEPSKRRLTWPNGALATLYSADEPERLRGPQHDSAWCDELASWRYLQEAWDMLMFGLRLGDDPRCVVTTTPKPYKLIKELMADSSTALTVGSTFENIANLAGAFIKNVIAKYEGTRLGRQELYAAILDDIPGALWTRTLIDDNRARIMPEQLPPLVRIVVAIDPAITANEDSNETGIVVVGKTDIGHAYVLADISLRGHPNEWAECAVGAYRKWNADRIIGEANQGGDMVESTVRVVDPDVSYKRVYASRGKQTRAEPVAALYEQGKIHHVGYFSELEDQMCSWVPGMISPDRVDALVWAITDLLLDAPGTVTPVSNPFYAGSEADY